MADIRIMSWNIEFYGPKKILKSTSLPNLIARTMMAQQADILVILELTTWTATQVLQSISDQLNALNYFNGDWGSQAICVGDEAVGFLFHHTADLNGFEAMPNAAGGAQADSIWVNVAGDSMYFPLTRTLWTNVNIPSQNGRRPAYMAFQTTAGTPFVVAGLHTPFAAKTGIQTYSAYLYGLAREGRQVLAVSVGQQLEALQNNTGNVRANMVTAVTNLLAKIGAPQDAVKNIIDQIVVVDLARPFLTGQLFQFNPRLFQSLCDARMVFAVRQKDYGTTDDKRAVVRALFTITTAAAAVLTNLWALNNTVPQTIINAYRAFDYKSYVLDTRFSNSENLQDLFIEAFKLADTNIPTPAPAASVINYAVLAGDFNVNCPDTTTYDPTILNRIGNPGGNAYTTLTTGAGANSRAMALNNILTTQSTNLEACFEYVWDNVAFQNLAGNAAYRDLCNSLRPLSGNMYCSRDLLIAALTTYAGLSGTEIKYYAAEIDAVFPSGNCVNNTGDVRANGYDNFACQGPTGGGAFSNPGTPDMLSMFGSWNLALNPCAFPAASATLNDAARNFLNGLHQPFQYKNNDVINPALIDVQDTGNFYKEYVSNHYPVCVTMTIP